MASEILTDRGPAFKVLFTLTTVGMQAVVTGEAGKAVAPKELISVGRLVNKPLNTLVF